MPGSRATLVSDRRGGRPRRHAAAPAAPDLIPLLDVIFSVLACFAFLLAMSELRPQRLAVELPAAGGAGRPDPNDPATLEIRYGASGDLHLDGRPLAVDELPAALETALAETPGLTVRLHGDAEARHGLTARILAVAAAAGAERVEIAVRPGGPAPGAGNGGSRNDARPRARPAQATEL